MTAVQASVADAPTTAVASNATGTCQFDPPASTATRSPIATESTIPTATAASVRICRRCGSLRE
ncbi:hypothetical protein [Saccharomonospora azurea]|uniref:hypothetical protein n=1 Tax=Saccharomonospora azurea TaxID=40988 RepID=UPI00331CE132